MSAFDQWGREDTEPVMETIPEEFRKFKYLVFRSKFGSRFFSTGYSEETEGRKDYRTDWYTILAGFDTMWECQQFLGFDPRHWSRDENGNLS